MKTILKSMVALSLVSSVAMGAELLGIGGEMMKVELENNATIKVVEKDLKVKFKYSKNKDKILVILENGETAEVKLIAHYNSEYEGQDDDPYSIVEISKNNKRYEIRNIYMDYYCKSKNVVYKGTRSCVAKVKE